MKDVTLNQLEQTRLHVLNSVLEHHLSAAQAAEILGVSERHAWRLLAAYRREGAAALAHGNRGRKPRNAVSADEANTVVQLAGSTYAGANHTHLTELLRDREGIDLSRPTVRRILTRAGISSPRHRRPPKHRVRRQRMPQAGMLVQIDGSFHRWLGDDGPQFTLLLAVDDATSAVVNQDRLVTELRLAGSKTIDQANIVLRDFLPRYNTQFAVPAEVPRTGLPSVAIPASIGPDPLPQAHPQGGQGQHGQVPVAHPATAARHRTSQLRRCPGGSTRTHRRPAPGPPRG